MPAGEQAMHGGSIQQAMQSVATLLHPEVHQRSLLCQLPQTAM